MPIVLHLALVRIRYVLPMAWAATHQKLSRRSISTGVAHHTPREYRFANARAWLLVCSWTQGRDESTRIPEDRRSFHRASSLSSKTAPTPRRPVTMALAIFHSSSTSNGTSGRRMAPIETKSNSLRSHPRTRKESAWRPGVDSCHGARPPGRP